MLTTVANFFILDVYGGLVRPFLDYRFSFLSKLSPEYSSYTAEFFFDINYRN